MKASHFLSDRLGKVGDVQLVRGMNGAMIRATVG